MSQVTSQVEVNSERQVRRDEADNSQHKLNCAEDLGIGLGKAAIATRGETCPSGQATRDEMEGHFSWFRDREEETTFSFFSC